MPSAVVFVRRDDPCLKQVPLSRIIVYWNYSIFVLKICTCYFLWCHCQHFRKIFSVALSILCRSKILHFHCQKLAQASLRLVERESCSFIFSFKFKWIVKKSDESIQVHKSFILWSLMLEKNKIFIYLDKILIFIIFYS